MSENAEPGRTVRAAGRPTVFGEHTSHNVATLSKRDEMIFMGEEKDGFLKSNPAAAG